MKNTGKRHIISGTGLAGFMMAACMFFFSCKKNDLPDTSSGSGQTVYGTDTTVNIPARFPGMPVTGDIRFTKEGLKLGRYLFYDPRLSGDNSMSCGSCHKQEFAFCDGGKQFSKGIHGDIGDRNSMALFNEGWSRGGFFWDGREPTLEKQAHDPVVNPKEMASDWNVVINKLKTATSPDYNAMFEKAFGPNSLTQDNATKALAMFVRSIISANSKYDKVMNHEAQFTPLELKGFNLFKQDPVFVGGSRIKSDVSGVDCMHCHADPFFQPEANLPGLLNNGVGNANMKVPSLRNLGFTTPYMHDGSFPTLDSVLAHYDHGVEYTSQLSDAMYIKRFQGNPGTMELDKDEIQAIKAFLNTLNDSTLVTNKAYSNPF
jgi:cytochrome c peroxidase